MEYQVAYHFHDMLWSVLGTGAFVLVFVAIGIAAIWRGTKDGDSGMVVGGSASAILPLFVGLMLIGDRLALFQECQRHFESQQYTVLEGEISEMHPDGRSLVYFTLQGQQFAHSSRYQKFFQEGASVRISYCIIDGEKQLLMVELPSQATKWPWEFPTLWIVFGVMVVGFLLIVQRGLTTCHEGERLLVINRGKFIRFCRPGIHLVWPGLQQSYRLVLGTPGVVVTEHSATFHGIEVPIHADVPVVPQNRVSIQRFDESLPGQSDIIVHPEPSNSEE